MPFAFTNWFGIVVVISTEALATTQYLSGVESMSGLMRDGALTVSGYTLATALLIVYLFINFYGVKFLSRINNAVTIFKMVVPILIVITFIVYALTHADSHGGNLGEAIPGNDAFGLSDAFKAIVAGGLIYTFNGFQTIVAYASEVQNPKRNIPLAIFLSLAGVLVLYLGLEYAFMQAVPHDYLISKGGWAGLDFSSPLLQVATMLGLTYVGFLLVIDSAVSPSATGYVYLGASSRMLYAMSSEGQAPRYFAKINEKYNISRRSLLFNFILAVMFLFTAKSWAGLMIVVTGFHIIGYMAAPISMGALEPKTKWFGLLVFIMLTMLLNVIDASTNELMAQVLAVLIIIYGVLEYKRIGVKNIIYLALPFVIFILVIAYVPNYWVNAIIAVIFYLLVTDHRYVAFCKSTANKDNVIVD
jgi:amino acid transporter